jgi:dTDP-4-dehydrorhamnose reductase
MGGRLLIFGGGGFVGGNLAAVALSRGWEVHIADRGTGRAIPVASWQALDVTQAVAVRRLVAELKPDAAVYLAAVADIDRAEREKDLAWAVNAEGARIAASACAEAGAACLYMSSDAVFAGTAEVYGEDDPPAPVNFYGRTKAEGEKAALAAHPRAGVVRISLALGFPLAIGNSFLAALEVKLRQGQGIVCPADELRTPIDVFTLASCLLELAEKGFAGIVHLGSTDSIDRLVLTRRAAVLMGYPRARISSQPAGVDSNGRAPRHKRGVISVAKARGLLSTPLLTAERSIRRAIEERL